VSGLSHGIKPLHSLLQPPFPLSPQGSLEGGEAVSLDPGTLGFDVPQSRDHPALLLLTFFLSGSAHHFVARLRPSGIPGKRKWLQAGLMKIKALWTQTFPKGFRSPEKLGQDFSYRYFPHFYDPTDRQKLNAKRRTFLLSLCAGR